MPVSLASLPRELMHILACFEPCAVAFSVRADRSLWERFREDARIWVEVVKVARDKGVEVLTKHAASILAVVPTLDRLSPVPLLYVAHGDAYPGFIFTVSDDGTMLACIADDHKRCRVFDTATMRERAVLRFDAMIGKLFISPSNQYIVVGGRHVHNRFWVYDAANKWKKRILGTDGLWRQFWFLPGDVLAAVSPHPMRVEYWDLRRGGDCVKVIPPDHVDVFGSFHQGYRLSCVFHSEWC